MGEKGQQWRNVVSRRPGSEICEGPVVTPFGGGGRGVTGAICPASQAKRGHITNL